MPDQFEAGSHNAIGIAGLSAGVKWSIGGSAILTQTRNQRYRRLNITALRTTCDHASASSRFVQRVRPAGTGDGSRGNQLRHPHPPRHPLRPRSPHEAIGTANLGGTTSSSFGPLSARRTFNMRPMRQQRKSRSPDKPVSSADAGFRSDLHGLCQQIRVTLNETMSRSRGPLWEQRDVSCGEHQRLSFDWRNRDRFLRVRLGAQDRHT